MNVIQKASLSSEAFLWYDGHAYCGEKLFKKRMCKTIHYTSLSMDSDKNVCCQGDIKLPYGEHYVRWIGEGRENLPYSI